MSQPKFKDYSLKTRKFINVTTNNYLIKIHLPEYLLISKKNSKKLRLKKSFLVWLKMQLIHSIYDLDSDSDSDEKYHLYLCDDPFLDIISGYEDRNNEKAYYNLIEIPSHIYEDIVNTINFYKITF